MWPRLYFCTPPHDTVRPQSVVLSEFWANWSEFWVKIDLSFGIFIGVLQFWSEFWRFWSEFWINWDRSFEKIMIWVEKCLNFCRLSGESHISGLCESFRATWMCRKIWVLPTFDLSFEKLSEFLGFLVIWVLASAYKKKPDQNPITRKLVSKTPIQ